MNIDAPGIVLFVVAALPLGAHAEEMFLCRSEEQLVFGCSIGAKMVSICASPDVSAEDGYMQYRFGTDKRIELAYPDPLEPPAEHFFLSTVMYSGGGGGTIRFANDGHEYFVFDLMVRTNFASGEPNNPMFIAGLVTRRDGRNVSEQLCNDESASIRAPAYEVLPREDYDPDIAPHPL